MSTERRDWWFEILGGVEHHPLLDEAERRIRAAEEGKWAWNHVWEAQERLRSHSSPEAWQAYLELEKAVNARAELVEVEQFNLGVEWALKERLVDEIADGLLPADAVRALAEALLAQAERLGK